MKYKWFISVLPFSNHKSNIILLHIIVYIFRALLCDFNSHTYCKTKNQSNANICNLFLFCADYPCFKEDGDCFASKLLFTHVKAEAIFRWEKERRCSADFTGNAWSQQATNKSTDLLHLDCQYKHPHTAKAANLMLTCQETFIITCSTNSGVLNPIWTCVIAALCVCLTHRAMLSSQSARITLKTGTKLQW